MHDDHYVELKCQLCGASEVVGPEQMLQRLRDTGMLKREKEPDLDLVRELFTARLGQIVCGVCGGCGLSAETLDEWDDDDWQVTRTCEVCHQMIPPERLEVFPNTRRCRDCQQSAERGEDSGEPEYCPRCGSILVLREQSGSGITRYVMHCPDCGYK